MPGPKVRRIIRKRQSMVRLRRVHAAWMRDLSAYVRAQSAATPFESRVTLVNRHAFLWNVAVA